MTSTVNGIDWRRVLERTDEKLAKRSGDDPLPAETIAAFARAVEAQLQGRQGDATQLGDEILRWQECAGEQAGEIERLRAEANEWARKYNGEARDQIRDLESERSTLQERHERMREAYAAEQRAHAELKAENAELADQLAATSALLRRAARTVSAFRRTLAATDRELDQARKDAETWQSEYERVRDDALDDLVEKLDEPHRHLHEVPSRRAAPLPCECGRPWPRASSRGVMAQARAELEAWGWPTWR